MVTVVVIINTLISLMLFYITWRVWKLKQRLVRIADRLVIAEHKTHAILDRKPEAIYKGQRNIQNLRQRSLLLQLQIQQARQIFNLLLVGAQVWRNHFWRLQSKSWKKRE
ncbi:MAG: hypothetical protein PUP93_08605 [Rhizonema sp. NSF051]|nr:hypothetical protein [Rhizonema sp. NSF051]